MSTCASVLLEGSRESWVRLSGHPFVHQAGDGTLRRASFDRWLVNDHFFVVGFRRFLTGLVTLAPDEHAADVLAAGLVPLQGELDLFRREAATRGLDLDAEPGPIALGYTAFLRASLQDGYEVALAVLYGAEKAYFDAWSAVRAGADRDSDYWPFVDNWSSPAFAGWVASLAGLLDAVAPAGPSERMRQAFDRVVRFGPVRAAVLERGAQRRQLVGRPRSRVAGPPRGQQTGDAGIARIRTTGVAPTTFLAMSSRTRRTDRGRQPVRTSRNTLRNRRRAGTVHTRLRKVAVQEHFPGIMNR